LGDFYGGDGIESFVVPNLQGRFIFGVDGTHALGVNGGAETHTLTTAQIPAHNHAPGGGDLNFINQVSSGGGSGLSSGSILRARATTSDTGGGGSHNNMPPFQGQYWIIKAS
jgi:microcystin-dependent protein